VNRNITDVLWYLLALLGCYFLGTSIGGFLGTCFLGPTNPKVSVSITQCPPAIECPPIIECSPKAECAPVEHLYTELGICKASEQSCQASKQSCLKEAIVLLEVSQKYSCLCNRMLAVLRTVESTVQTGKMEFPSSGFRGEKHNEKNIFQSSAEADKKEKAPTNPIGEATPTS